MSLAQLRRTPRPVAARVLLLHGGAFRFQAPIGKQRFESVAPRPVGEPPAEFAFGQFHILKADDIDAIRERLQPRVLIPMHYRHDDLEEREERPVDLGPIDPWLAGQQNVRRDDDHAVVLRADTLPDEPQIRILRHSPAVVPARAGSNE